MFLLPNTISKLQPMNQGVIPSSKDHYKTMSVEAIEKKITLAEFSILNAIQMLNVSWGKVMTRTAVDCSKKTVSKF